MGNSAAFYKTFYQYDDLFRLAELKEAVGVREDPPAELPIAPLPEPEPVVLQEPAPVAMPLPTVQAEVPSFPALQHKILVLVDEPRQPELIPAEALLLENILKATGHSTAAMDLLNFSYIPQADARTVLAQKSTNYFITFGVPLIRLQLDLLLPPYTPKHIEGIWFLLADPLSSIEADKALKKRLWLALQKMFEIA